MKAWTPAAIIVVALAGAGTARADSPDGFALDRFEPAERGSTWFVVDQLDFRGPLRPSLGATVDYAHKPLAVYDANDEEKLALVRHQLFVHLGGALVVNERFRFGMNLPVAAYQDGEGGRVGSETLDPSTDPALGDLRLTADVRLFGRHGDAFTMAAGLRGWLPTGSRSQFTGDGTLRIGPQMLASGTVGVFIWSARTALVYRPHDRAYADSALGSELTGAVGAGIRAGRVTLGPEFFGSTVLSGGPRSTPIEGLFGVHYDVTSGIRLGAGAGAGLTRGYGSPTVRGLFSIDWTPPLPPPDRDADGILDGVDACPDEAGVHDSDPEFDGCPASLPMAPEDTDGDGIFDPQDSCPLVPGVRTNDAKTNGCPPAPPPPPPSPPSPPPIAVVTDTEIRISEHVYFVFDSAELEGDGGAVLAAVHRALEEHPEVRKVRVEGHTDAIGDPAHNDELSAKRAATVVRWLVDRGIDPTRLESEGFGSRVPVDTNDTESGRARNRRVTFTILERTSH